MGDFDVAIVGGGHAGAQCAIALRQNGFTGSIAIISDEPYLPYERPPLSKEYFSGEKNFERILIRSHGFWQDKNITLLLGTRVDAIDPVASRLQLSDGSVVSYRDMVWAAGSFARKMTCTGHDVPGVYAIRNRADVDAILARIASIERVCIVGGGYIGLESAAVLSKMGKSVTVLEAQDRVLARVAGACLSRFYEAEHRDHGVDIRLQTTVSCIEERGGRLQGVRLPSGELIEADMVIVGIGIIPAVEPLSRVGAASETGVLVDENGRTSLPHVYAAGDCALHLNRFAGDQPIRLESVQNANDMATTVALSIVGTPQPYGATPWFWSNQFDLRLQTVGISAGYDREIVRGDSGERSFSVIYMQGDRVLALDCVNSPKDFIQGKQIVGRQLMGDAERLSDTRQSVKDLANNLSVIA